MRRPVPCPCRMVPFGLGAVAAAVLCQAPAAHAQLALTTTITYQGRLTDNGTAANGAYDFQFRLRNLAQAGAQVGPTLTMGDIAVNGGLFTVQLDFGDVFAGQRRWLEIGVRPGNSAGAYTVLSPLQELTATGYSLYSLDTPAKSLDQAYDAGGAGQGRTIGADTGAVRINGDGLILDGPHSGNGYSLNIYTMTGGNAVNAWNDGNGGGNAGVFISRSGVAGLFQTTGTGNSHDAVQIITNGNDISQAISARHDGLGDCGLFTITNDASQGEALEARTNGLGDAVQAVNTGTGRAGIFQIDNAASAGTALYALTNGTGLALRVEGKVGIGTATVPSGVLMAVDGKLLCEELEVQLSQDWPDYVFEEDYQLMPLEQLEKKIREDKHLPGIPSAKTIAEKGVAVGDTQVKLMEKVEELTLYMIEMNKDMKSLRQENEQLRARLARLESNPNQGARP